jgi:hypothetical protein
LRRTLNKSTTATSSFVGCPEPKSEIPQVACELVAFLVSAEQLPLVVHLQHQNQVWCNWINMYLGPWDKFEVTPQPQKGEKGVSLFHQIKSSWQNNRKLAMTANPSL